LRPDEGIRIDHIGHALDPALGEQAQATAAACPHYRWLGGLPHAATRQRIQRAHVLVHTSRMEGGAHVLMEAVLCGTPVLASRVPGNVGMLGRPMAATLPRAMPTALARCCATCRKDLSSGARPAGGTASTMQAAGALVRPRRERRALLALLNECR
jgi:glycosyltransferase involved in cell wall biosynthesis